MIFCKIEKRPHSTSSFWTWSFQQSTFLISWIFWQNVQCARIMIRYLNVAYFERNFSLWAQYCISYYFSITNVSIYKIGTVFLSWVPDNWFEVKLCDRKFLHVYTVAKKLTTDEWFKICESKAYLCVKIKVTQCRKWAKSLFSLKRIGQIRGFFSIGGLGPSFQNHVLCGGVMKWGFHHSCYYLRCEIV